MKNLKKLLLIQTLVILIFSNLNANEIKIDTLDNKVTPLDKLIMYVENTNEIFKKNLKTPLLALEKFKNYFDSNFSEFLYVLGEVVIEKNNLKTGTPEFNNFTNKCDELLLVFNTSKYLHDQFRYKYRNEEIDQYWNENFQMVKYFRRYSDIIYEIAKLEEFEEMNE